MVFQRAQYLRSGAQVAFGKRFGEIELLREDGIETRYTDLQSVANRSCTKTRSVSSRSAAQPKTVDGLRCPPLEVPA